MFRWFAQLLRAVETHPWRRWWVQAVSASGREVIGELTGVEVLPGLAGPIGGELLVEADQHVDKLTPDGRLAEQLREFRQGDEPVGIPRGPVRIGTVDDPVDAVMGLSGFAQELA